MSLPRVSTAVAAAVGRALDSCRPPPAGGGGGGGGARKPLSSGPGGLGATPAERPAPPSGEPGRARAEGTGPPPPSASKSTRAARARKGGGGGAPAAGG